MNIFLYFAMYPFVFVMYPYLEPVKGFKCVSNVGMFRDASGARASAF